MILVRLRDFFAYIILKLMPDHYLLGAMASILHGSHLTGVRLCDFFFFAPIVLKLMPDHYLLHCYSLYFAQFAFYRSEVA